VSTRLLVATRSSGKRREIVAIMEGQPYRVVFPDEIGLPRRAAEEALETTDTFAGNACRKAEYFARLSGLPTAADDSGLEVFALDGQPGVRSRRFALYDGPAERQDAANNAELLRRLAGAPVARRRARYRCVVVYRRTADAESVTFEGSCLGSIVAAPRGQGGFGYDPLFLSDELGKTFGEATSEEKHRVSHRGRAFRALATWLAEHPVG
jgi:XTP/dITP diphosphohydrolase